MSPAIRDILLLLHLLGAIVWIGGMFFAHFCLRPAAIATLDPPQRLPLFVATFDRFFRYTAVAVVVILASGIIMFAGSGLPRAPMGWNIMMALGLVMALIFTYIYLVLYPRLRAHCSASAWPDAAKVLNGIRQLVSVNLVLALCTVAAAVLSRQ